MIRKLLCKVGLHKWEYLGVASDVSVIGNYHIPCKFGKYECKWCNKIKFK